MSKLSKRLSKALGIIDESGNTDEKGYISPKVEIPNDPITQTSPLVKTFEELFKGGGFSIGSISPNSPLRVVGEILPEPVVYDDTGNSIKVMERCPMFLFGDLLDEVLESFGGVQEIMSIGWNELSSEGELVCLMNDWRVFRYNLKANEFSILKHDDRRMKINRECMVFEDMDDFSHWKELGGTDEVISKTTIANRVKEERMTEYGEKMVGALNDFFNGNIDNLSKMMAKGSVKNEGKNISYTDLEA